MEPVFMVLGQSAATAAVLALDGRGTVQEVEYASLRARLLADRQVLKHEGSPTRPARAGINPESLSGLVLDSDDASAPVRRQGFATFSASASPFVGVGYWHDGNTDKGSQSVQFIPTVKATGRYEVRLAYSAHGNRASNVPITIRCADGEKTVRLNQRKQAAIDGLFQSLGVYSFTQGQEASIEISNQGTDGYVIVDALQLLPITNSQ